jgi:hypothetical protein
MKLENFRKNTHFAIHKKKKKMSSFFGQNRLRIANYSTELKATIDVLVETYIAENQHDQAGIDKINTAREEWLKEVDKCEVDNLAELEKHKDRDLELQDEKLLKRFCFIFEFFGDVLETGCFTWRFVSTDTYLRPGQIACFQVMTRFMKYSDDCDYEKVALPCSDTLYKIFKCIILAYQVCIQSNTS